MATISGRLDVLETWCALTCDLAKIYCGLTKKCASYFFQGMRTVCTIWKRFKAIWMFLRCEALESAILPKHAPHDLKSAFCHFLWKTYCFADLATIAGQ